MKPILFGILSGIGTIILFVAIVLIQSYFFQPTPSFDPPNMQASSSIYQWQLRKLSDDQPVDNQTLKDKLVFINLWATWCAPCIDEIPSILKLAQKYRQKPSVRFLIISTQRPQTLKKLVLKKKFDIDQFYYSKAVPVSYGDTGGRPLTFIVHQGKIIYQSKGALNWNTPEIQRLIDNNINKTRR